MGDRLPAQPGRECRPKSLALLARAPEFERDLEIAASLGLTTEAFYALPESEQALQVAHWQKKRETCNTCGRPRSECQDADREWFLQRSICYVSMEQAAADARYDQMHKEMPFHDGTFKRWSKERNERFPYHYRDGVRLWVSDEDLSPHDHFLGGAKDCPVCNLSGVDGRPVGDESRTSQGHEADHDQDDR